MARGKTLGDLLTSLRAELRLSLNVAHNVQTQDTHIRILQKTQDWLWEDYTWPFLTVDRFLQPQAGQRYYDLASSKKLNNSNVLVAAGDMKPDRVQSLWVRDGDVWLPIGSGIDRQHFNAYDSDVNERAWPIQRWRVSEDEQIELWPIPDQNGNTTTLLNMVKVVGVRNLAALVATEDQADLDDQLIYLFAAVKLAPADQKEEILARANRRLKKLQGNQSVVRKFRLFGPDQSRKKLHGPPTVYYRTTS